MPHFLIIEARFYRDIADELARGAAAALDKAGATHDRVSVPGAFELPAAMAMAHHGAKHYDGYILLGCVARGETSHYDIVAGESARAAMDFAVRERVAMGNGVLTVENEDQAWRRAKVDEGDKGGEAAEAALAMMALRTRFGLAS